MRIICIDNIERGIILDLSINKEYDTDIKWAHNDWYVIINDLGCYQYYHRERFLLIDEFRSRQIDKLI